MAVKVFIKRLVPQDKARAMIPLFRQMRASADDTARLYYRRNIEEPG